MGIQINSKNIAARSQSFDRCFITSTLTYAIGEIADSIHSSRSIEIVIQGGAYLCNVWSRICTRPASYGRAKPGQQLSGRL
jgi:hypothetical protein